MIGLAYLQTKLTVAASFFFPNPFFCVLTLTQELLHYGNNHRVETASVHGLDKNQAQLFLCFKSTFGEITTSFEL